MTEGLLAGKEGVAARAPSTLPDAGERAPPRCSRSWPAAPQSHLGGPNPATGNWSAVWNPPGPEALRSWEMRTCAQRAHRTRSLPTPTSQVQQSAPGQSSRHLLRPPHSSPISSPHPHPQHTHTLETTFSFSPWRPCPGDVRGRERRAIGRGGDVERRSQPSLPATPTPTRQPSRGA